MQLFLHLVLQNLYIFAKCMLLAKKHFDFVKMHSYFETRLTKETVFGFHNSVVPASTSRGKLPSLTF